MQQVRDLQHAGINEGSPLSREGAEVSPESVLCADYCYIAHDFAREKLLKKRLEPRVGCLEADPTPDEPGR